MWYTYHYKSTLANNFRLKERKTLCPDPEEDQEVADLAEVPAEEVLAEDPEEDQAEASAEDHVPAEALAEARARAAALDTDRRYTIMFTVIFITVHVTTAAEAVAQACFCSPSFSF